MKQNVIRTIRNIVLTAALLAIALLNVGCSGDSTFLTPDSGAATDAYNLAECIRQAGDDLDAAAACLK